MVRLGHLQEHRVKPLGCPGDQSGLGISLFMCGPQTPRLESRFLGLTPTPALRELTHLGRGSYDHGRRLLISASQCVRVCRFCSETAGFSFQTKSGCHRLRQLSAQLGN